MRLADNLIEAMVAYLNDVIRLSPSNELLPPTTMAPGVWLSIGDIQPQKNQVIDSLRDLQNYSTPQNALKFQDLMSPDGSLRGMQDFRESLDALPPVFKDLRSPSTSGSGLTHCTLSPRPNRHPGEQDLKVFDDIDVCAPNMIGELCVIQTFDEKDAVSIREAKVATSSSTFVSDLAYVKSYFGNLPGVIVSLKARNLPLIKSVKIMHTIQEGVKQTPALVASIRSVTFRHEGAARSSSDDGRVKNEQLLPGQSSTSHQLVMPPSFTFLSLPPHPPHQPQSSRTQKL
uniref:Uncharacterized protein n=1 Tax=Timema cristinae TaxID=61476 RepID=A0A7R9GVQ7_TIMCR|nr:unnamed protein product [Timema cristinae]